MVRTTLLKKITDVVVLAMFVFGILGVLPLFDNFMFFSKFLFFVVGTLVTAVLYVLYTLSKKTIEIKVSPLTIPLFLFGISAVASTFFTNNYPVEAILGFGGVYIATIILSLLGGTIVSANLPKKLLLTASVCGVVLTALTGAQMMGYGPIQMINAVFGFTIANNPAFSLAGGSFFALQFLAIVAVGIIVEIIAHKHIAKWMLVVLPILVVGMALNLWTVLPGKPGAITSPSWTGSWSIALDTIRAPKAALIGGGTAAYTNMYLRYKPVWLNSLTTWNVPFSQASDMPFTLLVTMGFLGLGTWLLIVWQTIRMFRAYTGSAKTMAAMLLATFALQLCFPTAISILMIQAVLFVALFAAQTEKLPVFKLQALTMSMEVDSAHTHTSAAQKAAFPVYIMSIIILAGVAYSGFHFSKFALASVKVMEASKALAANDVVATYEKQQQAIQLNQYSDTLRRDYALTNLFIATSLSSKADISEAEKTQVATLLQQAVQEARSATVLDDLDVENWAVLARIYQNMIGSVDQADQFAVQAYIQAIANDPTNPALRIALGGIFLDQKQYQQAASIFQQAVDVKQDYANSHYNLAYALKQLGAYKDAQTTYKNLITLLESSGAKDTPEYETVKKELAEVDKMVAEQEKAAAKNGGTKTNPSAADLNKQPSIVDQNLGQSDTNIIKSPSEGELPVTQETNLSKEVQPSASPASGQ